MHDTFTDERRPAEHITALRLFTRFRVRAGFLILTLLLLHSIKDLHDSSELRRVVIQFLEQRAALATLLDLSVLLVLGFPGLAFGLKCEIDRLVGVDDEGNNDVDEDQVCQLDKCDEVADNQAVFTFTINELIHEHN